MVGDSSGKPLRVGQFERYRLVHDTVSGPRPTPFAPRGRRPLARPLAVGALLLRSASEVARVADEAGVLVAELANELALRRRARVLALSNAWIRTEPVPADATGAPLEGAGHRISS